MVTRKLTQLFETDMMNVDKATFIVFFKLVRYKNSIHIIMIDLVAFL